MRASSIPSNSNIQPNNTTPIETPRPPPSKVELLKALDVWTNQPTVPGENRSEAAVIIKRCIEAQFDPSSMHATSLEITGFNLTTLPELIGNLENLQYLYCNKNKLIALPNSIGNLKKLGLLNCENNQLTTLPESICNARGLRVLLCKNNVLTTLPGNINLLQGLISIQCPRNKLTSLPLSLAKLSSKCNIDFSGNCLGNNEIYNLKQAIRFAHEENRSFGPKVQYPELSYPPVASE